MVWYPHVFQNFPQFIVIHTVKDFGIVNKAEIGVFLELFCFFHDPADVGNLISGSFAFSKTSLNIWKFMVHVLLKPGLKNFEHCFTSMRDYTVEVRNRFKGLDLIDRVLDELWTEIRDIVQETGIKTIPRKRNAKKAKWLSEEALQIVVKRREAKSKGEKERYKHLNAEFQRIARRDKKAFFSDQCKEIEKNDRMGKMRDPFKKTRDTKGTLHAKMGSIKDRNGMDLTEAEDIKKKW